MSGTRSPGPWQRRFGDLTLTYLPDATLELVPTAFFSTSTGADWDGHPQLVAPSGRLTAGAGALLAELGGHRLLLDAGAGPVSLGEDDTPPPIGTITSGGLPQSFSDAALDPDAIEFVAVTHLHFDHVGWASAAAVEHGESLFRRATWLLGEGSAPGDEAAERPADHDGRSRLVGDGEEVLPGMRAWALPGHLPGHTGWVLDTGDGRRVIAFGDAVHSPAQIQHPDWDVAVDDETDVARESRLRLFEELSREDTIGYGVHFADRQLGSIRDGHWHPL
ncbi:MBL fold metallo-hydrolase [Actinomycetospora chiangmaiensis]|uniref:MBL fold metallo-hydrolase n=1 Tax=Actinomycetospora chiangmaiensis TaxID=402650 RepID=UPI00035E1546|nr:MBL fold metallo-hydrolase [Actinomycetospora chiangmaiensis]